MLVGATRAMSNNLTVVEDSNRLDEIAARFVRCRSAIELLQQCLQPAFAGQHVLLRPAARCLDGEY
jgi:hypothetical protein